MHEKNIGRQEMARRAYKISEVAATLGISDSSVRRMIGREILKPVRVLRHLLIPSEQIDALLKSKS